MKLITLTRVNQLSGESDARKEAGGSEWESNPPRTLLMPHNGFEAREAHRDPVAPPPSNKLNQYKPRLCAAQIGARTDSALTSQSVHWSDFDSPSLSPITPS